MFFFKKKEKIEEFKPNKKMIDATIKKGIDIGLSKIEIVDMVSRLDKKKSLAKVEKLVQSYYS